MGQTLKNHLPNPNTIFWKYFPHSLQYPMITQANQVPVHDTRQDDSFRWSQGEAQRDFQKGSQPSNARSWPILWEFGSRLKWKHWWKLWHENNCVEMRSCQLWLSCICPTTHVGAHADSALMWRFGLGVLGWFFAFEKWYLSVDPKQSLLAISKSWYSGLLAAGLSNSRQVADDEKSWNTDYWQLA